jgi:hypothetical protein
VINKSYIRAGRVEKLRWSYMKTYIPAVFFGEVIWNDHMP